MNEEQNKTWAKIVSMVDKGELKSASFKESPVIKSIKVDIDNGFQEWYILVDGSLSTQIKVSKMEILNEGQYNHTDMVHIINKLILRAKEIDVKFSQIHVEAYLFGTKTWRI